MQTRLLAAVLKEGVDTHIFFDSVAVELSLLGYEDDYEHFAGEQHNFGWDSFFR